MKTKIIRIDKPWGYEELLEHNSHYVVKRLFMKKGCKCSYQYHKHKLETAYSIKGALTIVFENKEIILRPGDVITIKPFVKHRMFARKEDCLYLESSTPQLEDVVRVEDDYGRK
jgi:mannose-6-phosphate isomerase-like protein (cupin superfamily)